jgi:hypothetical protein
MAISQPRRRPSAGRRGSSRGVHHRSRAVHADSGPASSWANRRRGHPLALPIALAQLPRRQRLKARMWRPQSVPPAQSSTTPARRNSGSVARSKARMTGPMRRRCTSHRRDPGSQMAPAHWRMCASSFGQRMAICLPSKPNSHGPMWDGMSIAGGMRGDSVQGN